jgi:hypothetical protein
VLALRSSNFPLDQIRRTWLQWRTQKNGQHGEGKMFTQPTSRRPRSYSPYSLNYPPFHRIVWDIKYCPPPLSVHSATTAGTAVDVRSITSREIELAMRKTAAQVYNLDPVRDSAILALWSAHSIRVSACMLLHALGFSPTQIKHLLRWRSDAFMDYLRNVCLLSDQQVQAFDKAAAMPHLLR